MSIFGRRIFLVRGLDPRRYLSSSLPTPRYVSTCHLVNLDNRIGRKLSEVTDVSKLAQEDTSRIELIWMARHQGLSTACSAIVRQRALVAALLDRAKKRCSAAALHLTA